MGREKKKKQDAPAGAPLWMCTFSDMMSLLLCFFVLLFAMSTIDKRKFVQAIGSIQGALGKIPGSFSTSMIPPVERRPQPNVKPLNQKVMDRAKDAIAEEATEKMVAEKIENEIRIVGVKEGLRFSIEDRAVFGTGSAGLSEEGKRKLAIVANELLKFPNNKIRVEGHTDNSTTTGEPYGDNWGLSAARALTVLHFLEDFFREYEEEQGKATRQDIIERSHNRLSAEANGQYRPLPDVSNETEEGRAQNRRVDIILLQAQRSEFVEGELSIPENPQADVPIEDVQPDLTRGR